MKYNRDEYTLSTGRMFRANRGILGISPELNVSEGYDGYPVVHDSNWDDEGEFTERERKEIASEMIARWERWAREGLPT